MAQVIDLRSREEQRFDELIERYNVPRQEAKKWRERGIRIEPLELSGDIMELDFRLARDGVEPTKLQEIKDLAVSGGVRALSGIVDVLVRGNYAMAGATEEAMNIIAPHGTDARKELIKTGDIITENLFDNALIQGPVTSAAAATTKAGLSLWKTYNTAEGKAMLAESVSRAMTAKNNGTMDMFVGQRFANELLSGVGFGLQGQKKGFRQVAADAGISPGPTVSEMFRDQLGTDHITLGEQAYETSEGRKELFGVDIGFTDDGKGRWMNLSRDGFLDPNALDLAAFPADVAFDPVTYITAGASGIVKAGGRAVTKKGLERLKVLTSAVEDVRAQRLADAAEPAMAEAMADHFAKVTARKEAERLLLQEARRDLDLLRPRGEVRWMGMPVFAVGDVNPNAKRTLGAAIVQSRELNTAARRFSEALNGVGVKTPISDTLLVDAVQRVGSLAKNFTSPLRADLSRHPEWLGAIATAEGAMAVNIKRTDDLLRQMRFTPEESDALLSIIDNQLPSPGDVGGPNADALWKLNQELDVIYQDLSQLSTKGVPRQEVHDMLSLLRLGGKQDMAFKLQKRLNLLDQISGAAGREPIVERMTGSEIFFRNKDQELKEVLSLLATELPRPQVKRWDKQIRKQVKNGAAPSERNDPLFRELHQLLLANPEAYKKRINALLNVEDGMAVRLIGKGDLGSIISLLSREDVLELTAKADRGGVFGRPRLRPVTNVREHVMRRGSVGFSKKASEYLAQAVGHLSQDDAFAKRIFEQHLVPVGSLEIHPNVNRLRVDEAIDRYVDESLGRGERGAQQPLDKIVSVDHPTGFQEIQYSRNGVVAARARLEGTEILDIDVPPEFQRRGVGQEVLADLVERGGDHGVSSSKSGTRLLKKAGVEVDDDGNFSILKESFTPATKAPVFVTDSTLPKFGKVLASLGSREEKQLFFRKWVMGEGGFIDTPQHKGQMGRRLFEVMNLLGDEKDMLTPARMPADAFTEPELAMKHFINEARQVRQELGKQGLSIQDMMPRQNLFGMAAEDGTRYLPYRNIAFDGKKWAFTPPGAPDGGRGNMELYMPESIIRALDRMTDQGAKNPEIGRVLGGYDTFNNGMKLMLTSVGGFPAFQLRNSYSNVAFGFTAAHVHMLANPNSWKTASRLTWSNTNPNLVVNSVGHQRALKLQAMRVMALGTDEPVIDVVKKTLQGSNKKSFRAMADDPKKVAAMADGVIQDLDQVALKNDFGDTYTHADLIRLTQEHGVDIDPRMLAEFTGAAERFVDRKVAPTFGAMKDWFVGKALRSNQFFEQFSRQQLFFMQLERGMAPDEAGRFANKWLLDYLNLAPIEKTLFKRLFPFYTFYRKATPLMAESLFTRTGPMSVQAKFLREDQEPPLIFGTELGERMTMRRGDGKIYSIGNVDLPINTLKFFEALAAAPFILSSDPNTQAMSKRGMREIGLMIHPAFGTLIEESTNFDLFSGKSKTQERFNALGAAMEKIGFKGPFEDGRIDKVVNNFTGKTEYNFDRGWLTRMAHITGAQRLLNQADRVMETIPQLRNGELKGLLRFTTGLRFDEITGSQQEIAKLRAIKDALEEEAIQRDVIFRHEVTAPTRGR